MNKRMYLFLISLTLIFFNLSAQEKDAGNIYNHVVVIGIDGMGAYGLSKANTPTMDSLMAVGSYTLSARAVLPTSSSSNWASMIMGAGPEQHGITSNEWQLDNHTLPPTIEGPGGMFPTIFSVIKINNPDAITAAVYQWKDFGRLFEKEMVDYDTSALSEHRTTQLASDFIANSKPEFCFIHIDHVDGAGHKWGYDSQKYYGGIERADELIKRIVESIKSAGIENETLLIISADHGGLKKGHGGESLLEMQIPVILSGKGIKKGFEINSQINIYDIASTVSFALGYIQPEGWIGNPIKSSFEE